MTSPCLFVETPFSDSCLNHVNQVRLRPAWGYRHESQKAFPYRRLSDQCWLLQLICLNCCSDSTQQRRNALGLPQWVFVSFGLCGLRILMRFRFSCFDHLTQSKNPPPWRRWQDGFYERKFKPKSASSILGFVGRNWVIKVISWFPNNGNQGSLYLYNARGLFPDGLSRQKPARLALPEMRPTLFGKIPGGVFELNETQTNLES